MSKQLLNIAILITFNQLAFCQVNTSEFSDSIKSLLIGIWQYESHETMIAEHLNFYEEMPEFVSQKLNTFAYVKIDNDLQVECDINDMFKISNSEKQVVYDYSIYKEWIWIRKGDIVISLDYEFDNEECLYLTYKPREGESRIKFTKAQEDID